MGVNICLQEISSGSRKTSSGLDVILVHGVATQGPAPVTQQFGNALRALVPKDSNILSCDLNVRLQGTFGWKDLWSRGGDLLKIIYDYHERAKANLRPLVFICHSLAGWVLKQMLWKASQQFNRFRDMIEIISGIVFLATPHITASDAISTQALSQVLRSDLLSSAKKPFTKADLSSIAVTSLHFEELKLAIPVLSCYETQPTKLKSLWTSRRVVLVSPELIKTSAPREKIVGIDTELCNILDINDSVIHHYIADFLELLLPEAYERLKGAFEIERKTRRIPVSSIRSPSSAKSALPATPETSDDPQNGLVTSTSPRHSIPQTSTRMLSSSPQSFQTVSNFEKVPSFTPQRTRVNLPCYCTKPYTSRNPDFQGRSDIMDLIDTTLQPSCTDEQSQPRTRLNTFALCGLGGIGKTQIAVEYMFTRQPQYDAVFWLQADTPEKLTTGFSQIAMSLGLETNESLAEPVASRELVKGWLAEPLKPAMASEFIQARWLLIFDNADEPDILHDFWPQDGQGSVLITSRDPLTKTHFYGNSGIDLGNLPLIDASALLQKLTNMSANIDSDPLCAEIVKKLDCFPLAIVQMSGVMWRRSLSLKEFLEIYDEEIERSKLHDVKIGTQQGYSHTLTSVWALEKLGPGASCILSSLSLLDPDCIQEEVLTRKFPENSLPGFPRSKFDYLEHLSELIKSSLVHRDKEHQQLSVHRSVQDVVKSQLVQSVDDFTKTFGVTVELISANWPYVTKPQGGSQKFDVVDRWSQCGSMMPHILRMKHAFENVAVNQKKRCATSEFTWLIADAAWYQQERGNPKECLDLIDTGFDLVRCGPDSLRDIATELHGTKGTISLEINELETALYHRQENTAAREEAYAKDHILTNKLAAAYASHGFALMCNGLFTKAAEMYRLSLDIRQKLPGFQKENLFNIYRGQGLIAWHNGDYQKAVSIFEEILHDRAKVYGPDDFHSSRTGIALFHLGTVRQSQGCLDSFTYHQRALFNFQATVGDNHSLTARACYKLSQHHFDFRNYAGALMLLDQASKIFSRASYYTNDLARVKFQTSQVLSSMGDPKGAVTAIYNACDLRRKIVVGDSREASEVEGADFDELVVFWSV